MRRTSEGASGRSIQSLAERRILPRTNARSAIRTLALAAAAVVIAVGLSACTPWPFTADTTGRGGSTPSAARTTFVCGYKQDLGLSGQSLNFRVSGPCGDISVNGNALTVRLESATSVTVQGQSIRLTAADTLGSLSIRGNDLAATAQKIGAVAVNGQNTVVRATSVGAVTVNGNDNSLIVHRKPAGYSESGQHNTVTVR